MTNNDKLRAKNIEVLRGLVAKLVHYGHKIEQRRRGLLHGDADAEAQDWAEFRAALAAMGGEQPEAKAGGAVADATLPVVIRGRVYEVPIPVQLRIVALEDALGASGAKPVCYLRTLNGAPDWADDCVCEEPGVVLQYHDEADGYGEMPLYATPPAPVVPEAAAVLSRIARELTPLATKASVQTRLERAERLARELHGVAASIAAPVVPDGAVLAEVLRRVAADPDGLLVLARLAKAETGRLRERFAAFIAAAPEPNKENEQ